MAAFSPGPVGKARGFRRARRARSGLPAKQLGDDVLQRHILNRDVGDGSGGEDLLGDRDGLFGGYVQHIFAVLGGLGAAKLRRERAGGEHPDVALQSKSPLARSQTVTVCSATL